MQPATRWPVSITLALAVAGAACGNVPSLTDAGGVPVDDGDPADGGDPDAPGPGPADAGPDAVSVPVPVLAPAAELAASVDVGDAPCRGSATATYTIRNTGTAALEYTVTEADDPLTVSPSSGTVAAGTMASLSVALSVAADATFGEQIERGFTLGTNLVATPSVEVAVRARVVGATLTATNVAFGGVWFDTDHVSLLSITNTGNRPVSVAIGAPTGTGTEGHFTVHWNGAATPAEVVPGARLAGASVTFHALLNIVSSGTSTLVANGPLCGASPTISFHGWGTVVID